MLEHAQRAPRYAIVANSLGPIAVRGPSESIASAMGLRNPSIDGHHLDDT